MLDQSVREYKIEGLSSRGSESCGEKIVGRVLRRRAPGHVPGDRQRFFGLVERRDPAPLTVEKGAEVPGAASGIKYIHPRSQVHAENAFHPALRPADPRESPPLRLFPVAVPVARFHTSMIRDADFARPDAEQRISLTGFRAGEYDPAVKEKRAILPEFRRELERIPPYRVFTQAHKIKLNQNESAIDLPARLRERILKRLRETSWNRYPDYPARPLESLIAKRIRVARNRVMVGHASNELLYAAALATLERRKTMVTGAPGYPVAKLAATLAGARIVEVPADSRYQYETGPIVAAIRKHDPRLVFLPSPNNPTGSTLSREDVASICDATDNLVMIDEAYREFSGVAVQSLLGRYRNLVLLRTLSKASRLAAFRIGYLVGDPDVLSQIERAKPPHSIDVPAQIAGETLFASGDILAAEIARVKRERKRVMKAFATLPGVEVFPSRANFFLMRALGAAELDRALLARGILIRAVGAAPTAPRVLQNCLRVSIGTTRENDALIAAARDHFMGGGR